ncbi:MAG: extracellular solute-binding protein [Clostridia bacterium]|nr:extracellular solute-binding protein [Clostridia bacterium]
MKRALSLILAMLMLVMTVAACGAKPDDSTDTTTTAPIGDTATTTAEVTTTMPEETVAPELRDDIPEVNFNGEAFKVLIREETKHEMTSLEVTGDLVGDAVYNREIAVEDRLGVAIEVHTIKGNWDFRNDFIAHVSNSILGGDHEFDIAMTHNAYLASMILRGLATDMNELEDIDFSKKWWCQKYVENIAINGSVYSAMGDIGVSLYEYLEATYFNKKIAEEHKITDLYELVESGNWTFAKMMEYVKQVGSDLNGDGKLDQNDLFGLAIDNHNVRYTATIWQTEITKPTEDGKRTFNLPNERYVNCYETLYHGIYDNTQVLYDASNVHGLKMFTNDQLLFFTERLSRAAHMKEMESEYGIIPFPKYDENQTEYVSATRDSHSGLMVANNIQNPKLVGTTIEALCMYGYKEVTPAYYETTLKLKYLSDETAMSMLDLIRDSVDFDFAILYTVPLSTMYSFYGAQMDNGTASIAAAVKAQSKAWQKLLDKMYEDFDKVGQ